MYAGITIGSLQNVMGVLYSSTNYQGMFNLQNVLPVVGYERSVFYRCVLTPKRLRACAVLIKQGGVVCGRL